MMVYDDIEMWSSMNNEYWSIFHPLSFGSRQRLSNRHVILILDDDDDDDDDLQLMKHDMDIWYRNMITFLVLWLLIHDNDELWFIIDYLQHSITISA